MGKHPLSALGAQVAAWRTPVAEVVTEPFVDPMVPGQSDEDVAAAHKEHEAAQPRQRLGRKAVSLAELPDDAGAPVTVAGVLAEWAERGYKGGRMANFTLESAEMSVRCVAWNGTVSGLHDAGEIPTIGSIVAVSGRVDKRTWDSETDEGETVENITKEIMAQQLWTVAVDDREVDFASPIVATPLRLFRNDVVFAPLPAVLAAPDLIAADLLAGESDGAEMPTPEDPGYVGVELSSETVSSHPVFFKTKENAWSAVWTAGDGGELLSVLHKGPRAFTCEPELGRVKSLGVHRISNENSRFVGWVVVAPDDFVESPGLLGSWPMSAANPTLADFGIEEPALAVAELAGEVVEPDGFVPVAPTPNVSLSALSEEDEIALSIESEEMNA
jgi:hypothetical protein